MNRKTQKTDGAPRKRQKLDGRGAHFYPPVHADDVSYQRNLDLLKTEMEKATHLDLGCFGLRSCVR